MVRNDVFKLPFLFFRNKFRIDFSSCQAEPVEAQAKQPISIIFNCRHYEEGTTEVICLLKRLLALSVVEIVSNDMFFVIQSIAKNLYFKLEILHFTAFILNDIK